MAKPKIRPDLEARIAAILAPRPEPRHPLEDAITDDMSDEQRHTIQRVVSRERERAPFRAEALRLAQLNVQRAELEMQIACRKAKTSYVDVIEFRIDGPIEKATEAYVRRQLTMSPKAPEIIVHIASAGGDADAGQTIYGLLRGHRARVTCYARKYVASAAFTIFLAGDRRIADPDCALLIHAITFPGTPDRDDWSPQLHGIQTGRGEHLRQLWTARGADVDAFQDLFNRGELGVPFSAAEALRIGVIHEVQGLFALDRPERYTPPATPYEPDADLDHDDRTWAGQRGTGGFDISAGDILGLPAIVPDWVRDALAEAGV